MIHLKQKIIVAIDGFSSCGKSSFAKLIARNLDYIYLDSGAMYRAVALFGLDNGLIDGQLVDKKQLIDHLTEIEIEFIKSGIELNTHLNGKNVELLIRGVEVSSVVSEVSKIAEVRRRLVQLQQNMGSESGIVMDGRDIGTVVFPQAEIKIFMEADVLVRAQRRYSELKEKGIQASLDEIIQNIENRDYQDVHRKISPLRRANDAYTLNNSYLTFQEQMDWFTNLLKKKNLLDKFI
jgi:cytidylate kinase